MGNRHGNKQLWRAARARMAETGESYQQARASLLAAPEAARCVRATARATDVGADLTPVRYFGVALALATFQIAGKLSVMVLAGPHGQGPFPLTPLHGLGSAARAVH